MEKRKKRRMFLNGKICILIKKFAKYVHLALFYVLDYSGVFYMHIEKWKNKTKKNQKSAKKRSFGGGMLRTLRTSPQLLSFFTPSLRKDTHKKRVFCSRTPRVLPSLHLLPYTNGLVVHATFFFSLIIAWNGFGQFFLFLLNFLAKTAGF